MHAVFKRQLVMSSINWWPTINLGQMNSGAMTAASIAGNVLVLVHLVKVNRCALIFTCATYRDDNDSVEFCFIKNGEKPLPVKYCTYT
jgi:hypothetical protein